jgi:hypothetical protein
MAITKTINIDVNTGKAVSNTQALNNEISKTNKEVIQTKENLSGVTSVADGATGGMISKFQGLTGVIGNVSKGFTTLKGAIIASGIGALVVIIGSIISAFKASEEGQNKFAKLMGVIGSVVGNVMDVISDLGEIIIGVLSGDSKAIKSATDFGKKIFDVVGLPVKNIITVVETLAKTLGKLFSGDISGAFDQLKTGVNEISGNFKSAANSINSGTAALKNFGQEALKEAKIAQQIADQRAKADKTERNLIVQRAEGDRKIAELREKAVQRDTYTAAQRVKMLKEAQAIEANLTNQEIAAAKLRADAKTKENALSKSTKEDLLEEENLKAKVIQLETQRLQGNRRLVSQIQTLQAEETSIRKAASEERKKTLEEEQKKKEEVIKKEIEDEKKRAEAIDNLRKSYAQKIEDLQDTTELQKIQRQEQRALAELDNLKATEEQKVELVKYYENLKNTAKKKEEDDYWNAQAETAIKRTEEEKKRKEDELRDEQAAADAKLAIQNAVLDNVAGGIGILKQLGEKNKALQKAAIIAENAAGIARIIINTKAANAKAIATSPTTFGQPWVTINTISGALGVAGSLLATKKALSQLGGGSAGSAPSLSNASGGGSATAPTAPNFNVVGNSGVNQIAQTLGSQQPVQAYVVSNNVTTAQALDRNIIQNASMG